MIATDDDDEGSEFDELVILDTYDGQYFHCNYPSGNFVITTQKNESRII